MRYERLINESLILKSFLWDKCPPNSDSQVLVIHMLACKYQIPVMQTLVSPGLTFTMLQASAGTDGSILIILICILLLLYRV